MTRKLSLLDQRGCIVSESLRRFLSSVLGLDQPCSHELVALGIPRWDADAWLMKLRSSNEISDQGWDPEVREEYARALAVFDDPGDQAKERSIFRDGEGPREKAHRIGVSALQDDELLALLLRTGTPQMDVMQLARELLHGQDGLVGLAGMEVEHLVQSHGLGRAKASEIAAAFELARRLARSARRERLQLKTPDAVAEMLASELSALRQEQFYCLPLDPRSRLLGEPRLLSRGDIDGTEAGPRLFFRTALLAGAATAIAVHNHPSGDPSPSSSDLAVTKRLVMAGRTVGCHLVDHIVIGDAQRFSSIRRDHGHLFG